MGFFSKIWGGIKKVAKKIGKGIKSAMKTVGKFVNKLGVVGQIGLAFILPGVGALIGNGITALAGMGGIAGSVGRVLGVASKFASTAGNVFKTVTDGIFSFVKNIGGSMVNKAGSLLGRQTPLIGSAPSTVTEGFQQWMQGVHDDVMNIASPFRDAATEVTTEAVENKWGDLMSRIKEGGFEDSTPFPSNAGQVSFEAADYGFQVPDVFTVDDKSAFAQDLGDDIFARAAEADAQANRTWLQKAADYGMSLGEKAVDNAADTFSSQIGTGIAQRTGLAPENKQQFTQVTNVIPKFDSTPFNQVMTENGFGYGAIDGFGSAIRFSAYDAYQPLFQGSR